MGQRPWGSIQGVPRVLLDALRQEQAMALSLFLSLVVSSWCSQSWGPFQPQQPSWGGQGVSMVAVGWLWGPFGGPHLLLDSVPALVGVPRWSLRRVPLDQLLCVGGHLCSQLGRGISTALPHDRGVTPEPGAPPPSPGFAPALTEARCV